MDLDGWGSVPLNGGVEQEAEPVVGEVAVAVAEAAELLDDEVVGFGTAVGSAADGVVGEDPVFPGPDGPGQRDTSSMFTSSAQLEKIWRRRRASATVGVV